MDKRRTSEPVVNTSSNVTVRVINAGVTPGPSDYKIQQSSVIGNDGPSYHMQMKTPTKDLREGFPAPGDYKHQSALSRISYSFAKRYKERMESKWQPGPGSYSEAHQTASNWNKGPRLDMEVRYRSNKLKEREDLRTPGPNSYRLPVESSKKDPNRTASPAWGFTTSPKSTSAEKLSVRASTPGPGAYEYSPKQGLNSCPRATIGNAARSSAHLLKGVLVPSPFVYNTSAEYCMRKEPAYTIGK